MSRQPFEVKLNPFIPYEQQDLSNAPKCFGNLWDVRNTICLSCKGCDACGSFQIRTNKEKATKIADGTPYLSTCSFDKVHIPLLITKIKGTTYAIALIHLQELSGFVDKVTLTLWLDSFLNTHNLIIKNGVIRCKH